MAGSHDSSLFMSPQQADLDGFNADFTPDMDYLDGDNFDFDNADLGGEMIGALPGSNSEHHEKRKNSGDSEEGDSKRQETREGEKSAKKPGRKPLTNEPTTKRKAQNRAAQRAFRERKERHLKDLETTVTQLKKADEANKHENGVLKAQVDRLQIELREYRKRLSLNSASGRGSSPTNASNRSKSNSASGSNNFSFDFPKSGALPGSQIFGNSSLTNSPTGDLLRRTSSTASSSGSPAGVSLASQSDADRRRGGSVGRSLSPQSVAKDTSTAASTADSPSQIANLNPAFTMYSSQNNMHGFANTLPQMDGQAADPFGDLFSPSILKSAGVENSGQYFGSGAEASSNILGQDLTGSCGGDKTSSSNQPFQLHGGISSSDSTSPSATSSNWNPNINSSCETSPEPCNDSPATKNKGLDSFASVASINNNSNTTTTTTKQPQHPVLNLTNNFFGFSDYDVPSTDNFDPVLFGDYRDSNEAIVGAGDFSGGFFDDALNHESYDLGSPSNLFGILQSPPSTSASPPTKSAVAAEPTPSQSLIATIDKVCGGGDDDYSLPATTQALQTSTSAKTDAAGKMISCNNIWNQLQANPDFQDGKFDLDSLCSELRTKARCSESGLLVDQGHVDAALRKLGKKDEDGKVTLEKPAGGSQHSMFEQASWDSVLKKMGQQK